MCRLLGHSCWRMSLLHKPGVNLWHFWQYYVRLYIRSHKGKELLFVCFILLPVWPHFLHTCKVHTSSLTVRLLLILLRPVVLYNSAEHSFSGQLWSSSWCRAKCPTKCELAGCCFYTSVSCHAVQVQSILWQLVDCTCVLILTAQHLCQLEFYQISNFSTMNRGFSRQIAIYIDILIVQMTSEMCHGNNPSAWLPPQY